MKPTTSQLSLKKAAELVRNVKSEHENVRQIYGGLCHSFPVMVRTCGLCQAVAFSFDKKTITERSESHRNVAHRLLLEHVASILGFNDPDTLLTRVRDDDAQKYMLYTRKVLSAWIFFKRFAVSILEVKDARTGDEETLK